MNTEHITSTTAMSEVAISPIDLIVASFGTEVVLVHVALDVLAHDDRVVDHHADASTSPKSVSRLIGEAEREHAR
jgi:hypothetical protein